ncbi:MAG: hypothetical protein WBA10_12725 [Elainellaceae cyanobacterium]
MRYIYQLWRRFQYAIATLACAIAAAIIIWADVYPLLAPNRPIPDADALVIEGWMPDYAIEAAAAEFHRGHYRFIVTLGSAVTHNKYFIGYKTFADLSAATLATLGVDPDKIVALPYSLVSVKRTATAAIALGQWLQDADISLKSITLCSLGPHARRSWDLYRDALMPEIQVGVLSLTPQDYEPSCWWRTSSGARIVVGEMIAYTHHCLSRRLNQVL